MNINFDDSLFQKITNVPNQNQKIKNIENLTISNNLKNNIRKPSKNE